MLRLAAFVLLSLALALPGEVSLRVSEIEQLETRRATPLSRGWSAGLDALGVVPIALVVVAGTLAVVSLGA